MKDEIKKIITEMQIRNGRYIMCKNEDISFSDEDYKAHILLDYITNLQEENEELKMTNLALADDITKNKIIKQEVLTECCGIPIGEIPMLKIQNDEYKQRIDKAIEYIKINTKDNTFYEYYDGEVKDLLEILKGE